MYPYAKQSIDENDIAAVAEAMRQPLITRGPLVEGFETAIAEYCGAQHGVAFSSGTTALSALYIALDVNSTDRLITTPNTYIGSVTGAVQRGARLRFVDILLETGALDIGQLRAALEPAPTRGRNLVCAVHYAGALLDIDALEREIRDPDAILIEDAAHALGATYSSGKRVGSCEKSLATIFSFHPAKLITTGEGGMVTTNDAKLAERLRLARNNGLLSGNGHMNEMEAALGLSQLQRMPAFLRKRRQLVKLYREHLGEIVQLSSAQDATSAHHLMPVLLPAEKRDAVREALPGTQIHYPPLYRHPALTSMKAECPVMEKFFARELSLPLYTDLGPADVKKICEMILKH